VMVDTNCQMNNFLPLSHREQLTFDEMALY
jgi:hypothetical protein